jgi:hypothetical protein
MSLSHSPSKVLITSFSQVCQIFHSGVSRFLSLSVFVTQMQPSLASLLVCYRYVIYTQPTLLVCHRYVIYTNPP